MSQVAFKIVSIPASPIIVRKLPIWVGSQGRRGSRLWVFTVHPAEVLPHHVLRPVITERLVAQVERVLQIQERDHEPQIKARTTRCAHAAFDHDATATNTFTPNG